MVLNTTTVGAAVTPVVVQTFLSHYLNRGPLHQKPTAHISYDEGLHLIRKFLIYASHHTVEDIQRFTSQWVPHPHWVKVDEIPIPIPHLQSSATHIQTQLGPNGIAQIGGKEWWQWRGAGNGGLGGFGGSGGAGGELKAEWIEMRADYNERKANGGEGKRVMLYVHGGAYFFGSTDEHRYQMQRHARKLKARVFARLAPQFPFPCGIQDCLAAYLYLLTVQDPTTIILAGDSAGGGMVLSLLVIMRDRGIPLPAGAILISPWVDLTHSFPSVAQNNPLDYIPDCGFHHRPSTSWPPPNSDELALEEGLRNDIVKRDLNNMPSEVEQAAAQGVQVNSHPPPGTHNPTAGDMTSNVESGPQTNTIPKPGPNISIMIDGRLIEIKEQFQMYTTNQLIAHPLVSPALQPSLGGLPPLSIQVGGGEMLRDEQIYIAHKAANPAKYPPGDALLSDTDRAEIEKWKPTDVQLQVWDDLCHVTPTLSFTRPAKHMYRSIAQFGAWALARAQKTEIEIMDDDDVSVISRSSDSGEDAAKKEENLEGDVQRPTVGRAGDPLPPFKSHMIRQRVDRHGTIYPLDPATSLPGCTLPREDIGVIKEGPVKKWLVTNAEFDLKYASEKRKVAKKRAKELKIGYKEWEGENVPPSAAAGKRLLGGKDDVEEKEGRRKKNWGMWMWSGWGSKHDVKTMERESAADEVGVLAVGEDGARVMEENGTDGTQDGDGATGLGTGNERLKTKKPDVSRSRSRRRVVKDEHQTDEEGEEGGIDEITPAAQLWAMKEAARREEEGFGAGGASSSKAHLTAPEILIGTPTIERYDKDGEELRRPTAGGVAFPFRLRRKSGGEGEGEGVDENASLNTLDGSIGGDDYAYAHDHVSDGDGDVGNGDVENEVEKGNGKGKEIVGSDSGVGVGVGGLGSPGLQQGLGSPVLSDAGSGNTERPGVPMERFFSAESGLGSAGK